MAKVPFAPVVAAMFGLIVLILIFMTPGWLFERLIVASGLPSLFAAAQPPLGETARQLSAIGGGLGVFAMLWAGLSLLRAIIKRNAPPKARGSRIDPAETASAEESSPITRRRRQPIFAEQELGAPFMSDEAIAGIIETPTVPESMAQPVVEEAVIEEIVATTEEIESPEPVTPASPIEPRTRQTKTSQAKTNQAKPGEEKNKLGDELARLQSALDRRAARGLSTRPLGTGDITSLRNALRGLS